MSDDFNPNTRNYAEFYSPRKYTDVRDAISELYTVNGEQLSVGSTYAFVRSYNRFVGVGSIGNPNVSLNAVTLNSMIREDFRYAEFFTAASKNLDSDTVRNNILKQYEANGDRLGVYYSRMYFADAIEHLKQTMRVATSPNITERFAPLLGFDSPPAFPNAYADQEYSALKKSFVPLSQTLISYITANFVTGTVINFMSRGLSQNAAERLQSTILTETGLGLDFINPENLNTVQSRLDSFFSGEGALMAAEGGPDPSQHIVFEIIADLKSGAIEFIPSSDLYRTHVTENGRIVLIAEDDAGARQSGEVKIFVENSDGELRSISDPSITSDESLDGLFEKIMDEIQVRQVYCFAAGTPVDMADGSRKPIEEIKIGDEVLAYDASDRNGQGALAPRRVTRTYATPDRLVLDFHGLKVTPGHVFLCGDGAQAGQHRMLIEILRADGAIVSANGTVLRAATNAPLGSREDAFVQVAYLTDAEDGLLQRGRMRAGTLILTPEGETKSVLDCLEEEGYRFDAGSGLIAKDGEAPQPLYWYGELPRPEDYVLKRSRLTDADLTAEPDYRPEVAAAAPPSKLGQGFTPAEGLLAPGAAPKRAGETLH